MPSLAELLNGQTSFDEIRRRGPQGTSLDNQQELQSQAMRNAMVSQQPQGFPAGMYQQVQPQPMTLMDILSRLGQAAPAIGQGLMGVPISNPQQPNSGFMGVRG